MRDKGLKSFTACRNKNAVSSGVELIGLTYLERFVELGGGCILRPELAFGSVDVQHAHQRSGFPGKENHHVFHILQLAQIAVGEVTLQPLRLYLRQVNGEPLLVHVQESAFVVLLGELGRSLLSPTFVEVLELGVESRGLACVAIENLADDVRMAVFSGPSPVEYMMNLLSARRMRARRRSREGEPATGTRHSLRGSSVGFGRLVGEEGSASLASVLAPARFAGDFAL